MTSSGKLIDKKIFRVKTYCFWIDQGDVFVDKKLAKEKYNPNNIVCEVCQGCQ